MGAESREGYKKRILFVGEASFLNTGFSNIYAELLPRLAATDRYVIAEFGSYARDDDPRIQGFIKRRWKFYGNMPMTPEEEQAFHQPDPAQPGQNTNQFGKWKFEHVLADFRPDIVVSIRDAWMCLLKGTQILTLEGVKDVSEVTTEDMVLSHDGQFNKVLNTFKRNYRGVVHKITPSMFRIPTWVTDKHPILAVIRDNKHYKNGGGWPDFAKVEPDWITPDKLSKGDFVCYPIPKTQNKTNISPNVARLLGYYAAEGCILYEGRKENGKIKGFQLTFGKNQLEQSYVDDVRQILHTEFNLDCSIKVDDSRTTVRVFNSDIGKFMYRYVPGLAHTKRFHEEILQSTLDVVSNVLTGLFRGDGGIDKVRGFYNTVSKTLAHNVFFLCAKLGFIPSFAKNKNKLNGKTTYRYVFSFRGRSYAVYDRYSALYYGNYDITQPRDYSQSNDDYVFLSIADIEREEGETVVYNMEVDKCQSYTSSYVMHNCSFKERSPFRKYFRWLWMPTVDSIPQKEEWIQTYCGVDYVMAYSDFGIDSLRKSSPRLELRSSPPDKPNFIGIDKMPGKLHPVPLRPGVDLKTFRPRTLEEKGKLRQRWGLKPDVPVILLVQRNQSRKRISEVIRSFALMKKAFPDDEMVQKSILLMHTAWPDNQLSIDFPRAIARIQTGYHGIPVMRKGIIHEVCSTFMCHNQQCGDVFVAPSINLRQHHIIMCPKCGNQSARTPTTGAGITREQLSEVYGMADIMVQMSIAEGCGLPAQEAKACGVPVLVTDYAAISEKGRLPDYEHINKSTYTVHKGGEVMKVAYLYEEPETTCWRAMTSMEDCAQKMGELLSDSERRTQMSIEARSCAEENYDWDKNWKEWDFILRHITPIDRDKTWDKDVSLINIDLAQPDPAMSDEAFIVWCYTKLLGYRSEHDIDEEGRQNWSRKLAVELSRGIPKEKTRNDIANYFRQQAEAQNQVELLRAGKKEDLPNMNENKKDVFEAIIL